LSSAVDKNLYCILQVTWY